MYRPSFSYKGNLPNTGPLSCIYCGVKKHNYIPQKFKWIGAHGERTNKCPTCNRIRCYINPKNVYYDDDVIIQPFPEWACLDIWCGYEKGNL